MVLPATARAALGTAAFEAALRGTALGCAPGAALEAAAGTASRPTARRSIAARRSTTRPVVIATGTERTLALRLARTVVASLAGAERAFALASARTILGSLGAGTEGPVAGRATRAVVVTARTCSGVAVATGRRIAVVTAARAILATGRATASARSGCFLFLRQTHEALHHDLATIRRCDRADALALTLSGSGAGLARIGAAAGHLFPRRILVGLAGAPHAPFWIEAGGALLRLLLVASATLAISGAERPFVVVAAAARALLIAVAADAGRALAALVAVLPLILLRGAEGRDGLAHRAFEIDAGFDRERFAELVPQHLRAHFLHEPVFEVAELERAE